MSVGKNGRAVGAREDSPVSKVLALHFTVFDPQNLHIQKKKVRCGGLYLQSQTGEVKAGGFLELTG